MNKASVDLYVRGRQGAIMTRIGIIQVGQVRRIDGDGQAEEWKAWLWPKAGQMPLMDTPCNAIACKGNVNVLGTKLGKQEQWWR